MKIFVCHSSKDKDVADEIQLSLGERFDVFYDEASLPPGGSYDDKIQEAIRSSDLFVFVASPNSLREGAYSLSELKFAQKKWKHPKGRVIPVLLPGLTEKDLPAYLRAVTVLKPVGNVAAETSHTAAALARKIQRKRVGIVVLALILLAVSGRIAIPSGPEPDPGPSRKWQVVHEQLCDELKSNLETANKQLEFIWSIYQQPPTPREDLQAWLDEVGRKVETLDFDDTAYQLARQEEEVVESEVLGRTGAFVSQQKPVIETRREALSTFRTLLDVPTKIDLICQMRALQLRRVTTEYTSLRDLGESALRALPEEIVTPSDIDAFLLDLQYLYGEPPTENADPGYDPEGELGLLTNTLLGVRYAALKPGDFDGQLRTAAQARLLGNEKLARLIYRTMQKRFAEGSAEYLYAKAADDEIDRPELYEHAKGVFVSAFSTSSAGRDSGLQLGDVIVRYDDMPMNTMQDYDRAASATTTPRIKLRVVRKGRAFDLEVPAGPLGIELLWF